MPHESYTLTHPPAVNKASVKDDNVVRRNFDFVIRDLDPVGPCHTTS